MRRLILLSVAASSLVSILLTMLVMTLALPGLADAQAARIRAEQFTLVGENGADRLQLQTGPGVGVYIRVLDTDGRARLSAGTGGPTALGGTLSDVRGFTAFNPNGTVAAGLGPARGAQGTLPLRNILILGDQEGNPRVRLAVTEDGTPSIQMMDANGNVTWRAQ